MVLPVQPYFQPRNTNQAEQGVAPFGCSIPAEVQPHLDAGLQPVGRSSCGDVSLRGGPAVRLFGVGVERKETPRVVWGGGDGVPYS